MRESSRHNNLIPQLLKLPHLHFFQLQLPLSSLLIQFDALLEVFLSFADSLFLLLADLCSHILGKLGPFLLRFRLFELLPFNQFLLSSENALNFDTKLATYI